MNSTDKAQQTAEGNAPQGLTQAPPPPMTATSGIHIETWAEIQKRRVELKNVKHAEFASQETHCFSATVYIDGKKAGTVDNNGHGGSNHYFPVLLNAKLTGIAKALPPVPVGDTTIDQDADMLIGDLLEDYLEAKTLKRLAKTKTLFRLKSETYQDGEWRTVKAPFSPRVKEHLEKKYFDDIAVIYNETL